MSESNGKVHVLVIVEDEPDMRMLIRMNIEADPRIVIDGEASTAEEAIDLAARVHPGLIVLDHQLDGAMMGIEAAPHLKRVSPVSKILLFTAFDLEKAARAEPAIDEFLPKSRMPELLGTAERLLGLEPL